MNEQRGLVYDQRQQILEGENLSDMIRNMMVATVQNKVAFYLNLSKEAFVSSGGEDGEEEGPLDPETEIQHWLTTSYGFRVPNLKIDEIKNFDAEVAAVCDQILQVFDEIYDKKRESLGEQDMNRVERFILLMELDEKWKDHLHAMDQLRASIGLRGYAQKDPKVAYKEEGYDMFQEMIDNLRSSVTQLVLRVQVREEDEQRLKSEDQLENAEYRHEEASSAVAGGGAAPSEDQAAQPAPQGPLKPIVNKQPKVGRNDPCPCGSGKKYKKCCGAAK
jgi:preprotein translocase subunit SecA